MRLIATIITLFALCGCSHYVPGPHPLLIIPDGFEGEVFLVSDLDGGITWTGGPLEVHESGILRIANLEALAVIRPDAYDGRYVSGQKLQNRNRGGDWDITGLWPLSVVGSKEAIVLYFVVGTYDEMTEFQNRRMGTNWKSMVDEIRNGERPNQALQPTPMLVTPRADARVAPSTGVADL